MLIKLIMSCHMCIPTNDGLYGRSMTLNCTVYVCSLLYTILFENSANGTVGWYGSSFCIKMQKAL